MPKVTEGCLISFDAMAAAVASGKIRRRYRRRQLDSDVMLHNYFHKAKYNTMWMWRMFDACWHMFLLSCSIIWHWQCHWRKCNITLRLYWMSAQEYCQIAYWTIICLSYYLQDDTQNLHVATFELLAIGKWAKCRLSHIKIRQKQKQ